MHIYQSVNREIYERYCMQLCEYLVTVYLDTVFAGEDFSELDRSVAIRFFKCEIFGLSVDWIENGMQDSAIEEIHHITELCRGLSDELVRRCRQKEKTKI